MGERDICAARCRRHDDVDATLPPPRPRARRRRAGCSYGVGGAPTAAHGDTIDTRAVCLMRETLARHSGLADFAFAMQGLGSGAITLGGTR